MPVAAAIFLPLENIYAGYLSAADRDDFLLVNRRQIKILVDSLWDQVIQSLFKVKPRNYTDARRVINQQRSTVVNADDLAVIEGLSEVLGEYDALIDKSYVNLVEKVRPVFVGSLKKLCIALTKHSGLSNNVAAVKLATILNQV